jgi:hypothetical protein
VLDGKTLVAEQLHQVARQHDLVLDQQQRRHPPSPYYAAASGLQSR